MKITKTNKEYLNLEERRNIANRGCDECPCCGERRDAIKHMEWKLEYLLV